MTDKFYNNKFGEKPQPPWKHVWPSTKDWPTCEEQQKYWADRERESEGQMHRCPQCGCLFTGGEA